MDRLDLILPTPEISSGSKRSAPSIAIGSRSYFYLRFSFLLSFCLLFLFFLPVFTFSFLFIYQGCLSLASSSTTFPRFHAFPIPGLIPTTTILIRTLIRISSCPGPIVYSLLGNELPLDLRISCSVQLLNGPSTFLIYLPP